MPVPADADLDKMMRRSTQSRLGYEVVRWGFRPLIKHAPFTARGFKVASMVEQVARLVPASTSIERERVHLDGFDAEIVRPVGTNPALQDGVVLFFHGGGFLVGGINTHRPLVTNIARQTGLPVMSVAYRQLPETNIDGSTDDCLTAYKWLLARGVDASKVVFAGDSAGGFLVFSTALKAADTEVAVPGGLVGISGWYDLDCTEKVLHENAARDPFGAVDALRMIGELGAAVDGVLDPASSPVNGNLAKLPPTLLIAAESEVLRLDAEMLAGRLRTAGVPCELQIWDGQVHAFPSLYPFLPESRAAVSKIGRFVKDRLAMGHRQAGRIA